MGTIFKYNDYQKYLIDWIHSRPRKGRGIKVKLAGHLGITPAHVSRIVNESYHLTLDQAARMIVFLELSENEGNYFLSLVEMARAGSPELREKVQIRLDSYMKEWKSLARVGIEKGIYSIEETETYFSSYLYGAIDVLVDLKDYQTLEAISAYFNTPKKRILEILDFLIMVKIIEKRGEKYLFISHSKWQDLPKNLKKMNNLNWRNRAIASLDYDQEVNFHENLTFSIDKESIPKIKDDLLDFITYFSNKYFTEGVEGEDEEDKICAICLDFFEIK